MIPEEDLELTVVLVGSLGPNCPAGHGSFVTVLEAAQNYVCKAIRKMQTDNIKSLNVKADAVREYNTHVHEWLKRTYASIPTSANTSVFCDEANFQPVCGRADVDLGTTKERPTERSQRSIQAHWFIGSRYWRSHVLRTMRSSTAATTDSSSWETDSRRLKLLERISHGTCSRSTLQSLYLDIEFQTDKLPLISCISDIDANSLGYIGCVPHTMSIPYAEITNAGSDTFAMEGRNFLH